jgi:hypothetical protein
MKSGKKSPKNLRLTKKMDRKTIFLAWRAEDEKRVTRADIALRPSNATSTKLEASVAFTPSLASGSVALYESTSSMDGPIGICLSFHFYFSYFFFLFFFYYFSYVSFFVF